MHNIIGSFLNSKWSGIALIALFALYVVVPEIQSEIEFWKKQKKTDKKEDSHAEKEEHK